MSRRFNARNYAVVIPAFNARGTIEETIESVLRQTAPPTQIVVVDDGSTDGTRQVAERFGGCVVVLSQSNQGPGAAMSRGMRHCSSPWIAAIDADDVWLPNKMERQLDFLENNEKCAGVFSRLELFGEGVQGHVLQDGWVRSTMTVRRTVFEVIGEVVDPPGLRGEMIDWIARAREAGFQLTMMPEVLSKRRVSAGSLSSGLTNETNKGYAHVARAALMRKRAHAQEVVRS